MYSALLLRNQKDPLVDHIVTCDVVWILYDKKRSTQCLERFQAPKHFWKLELHTKTVIITARWSVAGVIPHRFLNPDETITMENYSQQFDKMHQNHWCIRPKPGQYEGTSSSARQWRAARRTAKPAEVAKIRVHTLVQPAYSPDISPNDYHVFSYLDNLLCDECFKNEEDVKNVFTAFVAFRGKDSYSSSII